MKHGDVMVIPRIKEEKQTSISNELMRLYGLYIAEGCIMQRKSGERKGRCEGIIFTINSNEDELTDFISKTMKKEFGLDAHVIDEKRNRRLCIRMLSAPAVSETLNPVFKPDSIAQISGPDPVAGSPVRMKR